jgi:lipopolysaccharide transport system permease protein
MFETFKNAWQQRDLIMSFAMRDIKARYKQTALGAAWAVLQPLSMMLVFTAVFSLFAKIPSDGVPYPVFAYSSLLFWIFFANVLSGGTVAMVANSPLIRKIYFPRETLLIAVIMAGSLDLVIASLLFAVLLVYYKIALTLSVLWVIPLLLLQMLFSLGLVSLFSAIHVNFRDIGHGLPLLSQLWMFATPVAYPLSVVPKWILPIYMLNPMTPIIDGYRRAILQGIPPDFGALSVAAILIVLCCGVALTVFKRAEGTFADVI